ncbi:MAG: threonyl-tRNA synthetase editing domain-containing protein [Planctomycetota bacterium]
MKLLMFQVREFWFRTHTRNLESEEEREEEGGLPDGGGLLAWVQVESGDPGDRAGVVRKAIKTIKWLARKHDVERIVLHSFAHLSDDRAEPEEAAGFLEAMAERLSSVGFEVTQTPWGYFNEFRMHVEGPGLAKVFKSIEPSSGGDS